MNFNLTHFLYALLNILNEMSPYILLGFLLAGILHVFVRPEVMSRHLAGHGWKPVIKAALLGIPLPLCSCGVLPTAISLRRRGASAGATTSFLIATPQTGVDSIAATYALLGLPFAIIRPVAALAGAFAGGMAVDAADGESTGHAHFASGETAMTKRSFLSKVVESVRYGLIDMVASVGKWLVIGLIVAAVITVAVPDELFLSLSSHPLAAMLLMVAVAVPMYICATGSIPIAMSLMLKGLSPGVAFVLLMAGPAANFASVLLLRKSIGGRSTAIYVGSVIVTAIAFGMIIDYLLPASWFALPSADAPGAIAQCHAELPLFSTLCSVVLGGLLIYSFFKNRSHAHHHHAYGEQTTSTDNNLENNNNMQKTYKVKGMACAHCKATVEKAVCALPGVNSATADLSSGTVTVDGTVEATEVVKAISLAGFEPQTN